MTKNHLLWISCALAIVGLLVLPATAATQEKIAFSRGAWEDMPGVRIHVVNPDGTGLSLLNEGGGDFYEEDPAWAPDGSMIVFSSDATGVDLWNIFGMAFSGAPKTLYIPQIPVDAWAPVGSTNPAWSPDSSRLAFASDIATWDEDYTAQNRDIYVTNPDGSMPTRLTTDPAADTEPTWSPDGSRIAFTTFRDGDAEICVMNADGTGQVLVTENAASDTSPAWSPDGRIAFVSDRDGNEEIYVMDPDGSGQARLTDDPRTDRDPAWSPDGARMVFVADGELYLMNADGTGQVPQGAGGGYDPAWGVVTVTPAAAIADLEARVEDLDLRHGIEAGLTDKLEAAAAGLSAGNEKKAVNNLNAFVNMVRAQGGKAIPAADAATLTAGATSIVADLRP